MTESYNENQEMPTVPSPEGIVDICERLIDYPTGDDPRIAAHSEATKNLILKEAWTDDRLRASLMFGIEQRAERGRPTTNLQAYNLFLRACNHLLRDRPDFAKITLSAGGWQSAINSIFDDPEMHFNLDRIMALSDVMTNIDNRERGPQLILQLYRHRFDKPIRLLDIGSSVAVGTRALMLGRVSGDIKVMQPAPGEVPASIKIPLTESLTVSKYITSILEDPLDFGECTAVDLNISTFNGKLRDPAAIQWAKSCHYPSEIVNNPDGVLDRYDEIVNIHPPNLTYARLDISVEDQVEEFLNNESPSEKYDVITFLTMLHQLTPQERLDSLENAKKMLAPGGLIIIQDFVKVGPDGETLEFPEIWTPYTYRTIVIDDNSHYKRPQELLWWSSGRCKETIIAPSANFFTSYQLE